MAFNLRNDKKDNTLEDAKSIVTKSIPEDVLLGTKFRGTDVFIKTVLWLKSLPREERPPVLVYGDPDIDGLVSMRELLNFLIKELEDDSIPYYCNTNRSHGFTLPLEKVKGYYIFGVDFAVDRTKMEEIVNSGVTLIQVDHHECEELFVESKNEELGSFGLMVNNQYPFENQDWLFQSGMGVLYHVIGQYYLETTGSDFYLKDVTTRALVGLTLLSDVRNIEMPYAHPFLTDLYEHPVEGYIGYLVESVLGRDYVFGTPRLDRNFVDFTFSPKVNALFRFNLENQAINFILGYGYPEEDYQALQRAFVERLEESIEVFEYPNVKIIEIPSFGLTMEEKSYVSNFVGLLASRYTSSSNVVIAYYSDNGVVGRASFRGSIQTVDFRRELIKVGVDGRGHASAYGIIGFEKDFELFDRISEVCTELFEGITDSVTFVDVPHLGIWMRNPRRGYRISRNNCYLLGHHRTYLRYTGSPDAIHKKRGNDKYAVYEVNGIEVRTFDVALTFEDGLILPMLEKGRPVLQLARKISD